jgi:hypothetical protein
MMVGFHAEPGTTGKVTAAGEFLEKWCQNDELV